MVISKMILHLNIGKGYEKYMKIFISFMVVVQLVSGISSLWNRDYFKSLIDGSDSYYRLWEEEVNVFEEKLIRFQNEMEEKRKLFLQQENNRLSEAGKKEESGIGSNLNISIDKIRIE